MNINKILIILLLTSPLLVSCSPFGGSKDEASNDTDNSACGDRDNFVVQGKKYKRLSSADGYKATGSATIYQSSTKGRGAGCKAVDMSGYTAAHKTLPLPTHIKITNKVNGKSVVVKVNDRGPASKSSLIQVTPAVAAILGAKDSFPVEIESLSAMSTTTPSATSTATASTQKPRKAQRQTAKHQALRSNSAKQRRASRPANAASYYIVIGTYASKDEALDKFIRLSSIGISNAAMETRKRKSGVLTMVRIGPFYRQDEIDQVKNKLQNDGLVKFTVVRN